MLKSETLNPALISRTPPPLSLVNQLMLQDPGFRSSTISMALKFLSLRQCYLGATGANPFMQVCPAVQAPDTTSCPQRLLLCTGQVTNVPCAFCTSCVLTVVAKVFVKCARTKDPIHIHPRTGTRLSHKHSKHICPKQLTPQAVPFTCKVNSSLHSHISGLTKRSDVMLRPKALASTAHTALRAWIQSRICRFCAR